MSDKFNDMRRRVINSRPCPVQFWDNRPGCWPYGILFLCKGKDREATFGDLTIPITREQEDTLIALALGQGRAQI